MQGARISSRKPVPTMHSTTKGVSQVPRKDLEKPDEMQQFFFERIKEDNEKVDWMEIS